MADGRRWALVAGIIGAVTLGVYLAVTSTEGNSALGEVAPWAVSILVATVLAFVAAWATSQTLASISLLGAAVIFGVAGYLAVFSIGLPLVIASAMSVVAYQRLRGLTTRKARGDRDR